MSLQRMTSYATSCHESSHGRWPPVPAPRSRDTAHAETHFHSHGPHTLVMCGSDDAKHRAHACGPATHCASSLSHNIGGCNGEGTEARLLAQLSDIKPYRSGPSCHAAVMHLPPHSCQVARICALRWWLRRLGHRLTLLHVAALHRPRRWLQRGWPALRPVSSSIGAGCAAPLRATVMKNSSVWSAVSVATTVELQRPAHAHERWSRLSAAGHGFLTVVMGFWIPDPDRWALHYVRCTPSMC